MDIKKSFVEYLCKSRKRIWCCKSLNLFLKIISFSLLIKLNSKFQKLSFALTVEKPAHLSLKEKQNEFPLRDIGIKTSSSIAVSTLFLPWFIGTQNWSSFLKNLASTSLTLRLPINQTEKLPFLHLMVGIYAGKIYKYLFLRSVNFHQYIDYTSSYR